MFPKRASIVLLPLLLAGCAAASAGDSALAGTSWRFTRIDGAVPASTKAMLTFERDRLGANVGCNGMGGPWRIAEERLIAGPLVQTQMYCEGPVWAQEQAAGKLLSGGPKIVVDGARMTLTTAGHSAELLRVR